MAQMAREKDGGRAPRVRDVNIEMHLLNSFYLYFFKIKLS